MSCVPKNEYCVKEIRKDTPISAELCKNNDPFDLVMEFHHYYYESHEHTLLTNSNTHVGTLSTINEDGEIENRAVAFVLDRLSKTISFRSHPDSDKIKQIMKNNNRVSIHLLYDENRIGRQVSIKGTIEVPLEGDIVILNAEPIEAKFKMGYYTIVPYEYKFSSGNNYFDNKGTVYRRHDYRQVKHSKEVQVPSYWINSLNKVCSESKPNVFWSVLF